MKGIIDSIEQDIVAVEIDGEIKCFSKGIFPKEATTGDVVEITDDFVKVLKDETEKLRKEIEELMEDVWED